MAKKTGINQVHTFTDDFYEVTGVDEGTRGEAVKALWDYAKENNLKTNRKNPQNGRNEAAISADQNLASIAGKRTGALLGMGDIAKIVSAHIAD